VAAASVGHVKTFSTLPRVVLVTRKTPLELLVEHHGTLGQARFYLESRGQEIAGDQEAHERFESGLAEVVHAIPPDQRRVRIDREQLDRFLFAPDDVVVIVGQDGLVPNVAKYLSGQLTLGINPDPERYDGVLCRHSPRAMPRLLAWALDPQGPAFAVERRTMAVARREDGQRLFALNEIFAGHQSHQSARYRIRTEPFDARDERHSSSGVVCATGTGATGWARSICEQSHPQAPLPRPDQPRLAWFVREPFPSVFTQTGMQNGFLGPGETLVLSSEMGERGVVFADGIEADRLEFLSGQVVTLGISASTFNLVVAVSPEISPEKDPAAAARPVSRRTSRSR
jgi:NAD kinase